MTPRRFTWGFLWYIKISQMNGLLSINDGYLMICYHQMLSNGINDGYITDGHRKRIVI
jgi:hypothetical protein